MKMSANICSLTACLQMEKKTRQRKALGIYRNKSLSSDGYIHICISRLANTHSTRFSFTNFSPHTHPQTLHLTPYIPHQSLTSHHHSRSGMMARWFEPQFHLSDSDNTKKVRGSSPCICLSKIHYKENENPSLGLSSRFMR
jgi:hypothetical protein